MLHLFRNSKGKFELASVGKTGDYVVGSKQGYERRSGVYTAMRSMMPSFESDHCFFQDDTKEKSVVHYLGKKGSPVKRLDMSPQKKYIPKK